MFPNALLTPLIDPSPSRFITAGQAQVKQLTITMALLWEKCPVSQDVQYQTMKLKVMLLIRHRM